MSLETTLILLKPDCVTKSLCGEVIKRFEAEGFKIRGTKMLKMSNELLQEHYAHISDKPFFPSVVEFMTSSPIIAIALEGEGVIGRVRDLLGPTDSTKADEGTIRGDLGVDTQNNVCHASDSSESAQAELKRFFADGELFSY
ncbi:MAG: nucleoside-diphosphate kinase [Verrucomicrobiales bacterium]|nr:nucleoside-diphosphate kinase [Verrucomicrobiales bacterium]